MPQRDVTITPHQERFVEAVLESGQYGNISEVFRAGLRLLERDEQARLIEREIISRNLGHGIQDMKEGRYTEINSGRDLETFFTDMRRERLQNLGQG